MSLSGYEADSHEVCPQKYLIRLLLCREKRVTTLPRTLGLTDKTRVNLHELTA